MQDQSASDRWTGWLEVSVHDSRDWVPGTLQLVVGADEVIVSYGGQRVDSVDRDRFLKWLSHPQDSLHEIFTAWTVAGNALVVEVLSRAGLALVVLPAEIDLLRQAIKGERIHAEGEQLREFS